MESVVVILIGFAIGCLTAVFLKNPTYHGPNSKDIINSVYQFGDKYWQFNPVITVKPLNTGLW